MSVVVQERVEVAQERELAEPDRSLHGGLRCSAGRGSAGSRSG